MLCLFSSIELDEDLEEIERKIRNIVKSAKAASKKTNAEDIVVSRIVGFFVSDWNKWIRCVVKAKDTNGTFYLWAPDYGLPFTGKESQIIAIPLSFQGMTIKYKVHLGGLIDCVPAEMAFDISTGNIETKISKSWSTTGSEKLGEILKMSLALEFKDIHTHYPMKKPHFFGRLMIQLVNGSWYNATKGLLNLQCAVVSHDHWDDILKKHDSYHQEIWRTKDGTPLSYATTVIPIKCNAIVQETDDVGNALDCRLEADQNTDGIADDCLSRVEIDQLTLEDQRILDTSASRIGYGGKRPQHNRNRIDPNSRTAKNRNRSSNYPTVEQIINGSGSNNGRNSNEFFGRANRNTNPVRRNDNNHNNNNNYYRHENRQGFEYNGRPFPGPSDGLFRPIEVQGGYHMGYRGEYKGYPIQNGNDQQRQTNKSKFGNNYNRSGQFESKKQARKNSNSLGRLEKINENSPGGRENVEKAVEDQNKNVEKPIKSEISDVPKDNINETTENVNVLASESAAGTSSIKSEQ